MLLSSSRLDAFVSSNFCCNSSFSFSARSNFASNFLHGLFVHHHRRRRRLVFVALVGSFDDSKSSSFTSFLSLSFKRFVFFANVFCFVCSSSSSSSSSSKKKEEERLCRSDADQKHHDPREEDKKTPCLPFPKKRRTTQTSSSSAFVCALNGPHFALCV